MRVAPGTPRRAGALPAAVHDVGAAALGGALYLFGGGTRERPDGSDPALGAGRRTRPVGHLPAAMSDTRR